MLRCLSLIVSPKISPLGTTTRLFQSSIPKSTTAIDFDEDVELKNSRPYEEMPGFTNPLKSALGVIHFLPVIGKYNYEPIRLTDIHMDAHKAFGKIYRVRGLLNVHFVLTSDPEIIRKAFQYDGKYPQRRMLDIVKIYRNRSDKNYPSAGILIENGEAWANTRFKVQAPMLRTNSVDKYIPKMLAVSSDFVDRLKNLKDAESGEIPEFLNEIYKWALESIGLIAFNTRLGCLDHALSEDSKPQKMITAINESFSIASDAEFGPKFWQYWPTLSKKYRKFVKIQDYMHEVTLNYIEDNKKRLSEVQKKESDLGILETILQQDIHPKEIACFMCDLLQAGVDTTSHSLGALLYLLAKNPDKQEKLYTHITQVVKSDADINRKILDDMPYLRGCIKESMRMMAVVDGTQRFFNRDIVLGGYRIPAGTYVVLLSQVAAKLADNYEEPDKFKPERWLPGAPKAHPFSNLPFGFGPRACIGRRIAMQEIELFLIKIIQNFRIEYHYEDIQMMTRFVAMPDKPLKFKFVERNCK